ncbi:MAG: FHA domain-containing protein [Candidatus Aureabacteria bacterium]|nr:FHA domain-containing protein [Candidatus Auribacterota bacterium]
MGQLVILEGSDQGKIFILRTKNIIGRYNDCSLVINDKKISSKHCKIEKINRTEFSITDLNSSNGTFVNGFKLTQSRTLQYGDIILIGETLMVYQTLQNSQTNTTMIFDSTRVMEADKTHCSKPLAHDWLFCPYCGKPV